MFLYYVLVKDINDNLKLLHSHFWTEYFGKTLLCP